MHAGPSEITVHFVGESPTTLASCCLYVGSHEVYYGKALRHAPIGTSIEDLGIYFRMTSILF